MGSNRYNSLSLTAVYKDGNNYTINRVVKIERFFNSQSKLALRIYYETNADGCVNLVINYDDINAILIIGEM